MVRHPLHEVLLVDPSDDVRAVLTLYLRMRNVRVTATCGPDDTLQRLRAGFRPCVVLTDPRASRSAGWELVDHLRADSVLARVPLVLLANDALQSRCARWHGVDACLDKPAAPAQLVATIERLCRRLGKPRPTVDPTLGAVAAYAKSNVVPTSDSDTVQRRSAFAASSA